MQGTTVGSYRITEKLGQGGMGVVYAAVHDELDRRAVIKVLRAKYSHDPYIARRFRSEAKAAAKIRHPGIVDVMDIGRLPDGSLYILMEHLDGETMARRLERERRLPESIALSFIQQAARALVAAHEHQIIHRDLKPENIFLCPDADVVGGERIKLLDFGIAKLSQGESTMVTGSGIVMGTPPYMSPEQCRGAGRVDHRTDLYALGVILFRMLCGRCPFVEEGLGDYIVAHISKPAPAVHTFNPEVTPHVAALVARLLEKDPDRRPGSAHEVVDTLDAMIAAVPGSHARAATNPSLDFGPTRRVEPMVRHNTAPTIPRAAGGPDSRDGAAPLHPRSSVPSAPADVPPSAPGSVGTWGSGDPLPGAQIRSNDVPGGKMGMLDRGSAGPGTTLGSVASQVSRVPPMQEGSSRRRIAVSALAGVGMIGLGMLAWLGFQAITRPDPIAIGSIRTDADAAVDAAPMVFDVDHVDASGAAGGVDAGQPAIAVDAGAEVVEADAGETKPSGDGDTARAKQEPRRRDDRPSGSRTGGDRSPPRAKKSFSELSAEAQQAVTNGQFGAALRACRDGLKLRGSDSQMLTLCAVAACKLKNRATAKRYRDRLRSGSQKAAIDQVCLGSGVSLDD